MDSRAYRDGIDRDPGHPVKLAKSSGKSHPFMIWVHKCARPRFRRQYQVQLDMKNRDHTEILNSWYMQVPEEEKAEYKAEAIRLNSDPAAVTQRRWDAEKARRSNNHKYAYTYYETEKAHKTELRSYQEEQRRIAFIPAVNNCRTTIPFVEEAILARRHKDLTTLASRVKFRYFFNTTNEHRPSERLFNERSQFISILPYSTAYFAKDDMIWSWPAEIAITEFNIEKGIMWSESIFVQPDPGYSSGNKQQLDEASKEFLDALGIRREGARDSLSPMDAWKWVKDRLDNDLPIFCDLNQYLFVGPALEVLAIRSPNINDRHFFQEKVATPITTIQDYAIALIEGVPRPDIPIQGANSVQRVKVAEKSREQIEEELRVAPNTMITRNADMLCPRHRRFRENVKDRRFFCAKEHSATILHTFYSLLKSQNIANFHEAYRHDIHYICDQTDVETPGILGRKFTEADHRRYKAENIRRREGTLHLTLADSDNEDDSRDVVNADNRISSRDNAIQNISEGALNMPFIPPAPVQNEPEINGHEFSQAFESPVNNENYPEVGFGSSIRNSISALEKLPADRVHGRIISEMRTFSFNVSNDIILNYFKLG